MKKGRKTDRQTGGRTDRQTYRQPDRQTDRQKYRQTDTETDRQTDSQTDRQTEKQDAVLNPEEKYVAEVWRDDQHDHKLQSFGITDGRKREGPQLIDRVLSVFLP